MIYTVTLNPALDRAIELDELVPDDANRIKNEKSYAGGKGIDASRVIKVLGGESIALGFVGGFNGMELEQRLLRQGVICDFVETRGETRTNILIFEKTKKTHTSLNASGTEVNEVEVRELIEKIDNIADPEYVIISGSIPRGVKKDIYKEIVTIVKRRGAIVVLDSDGEVMKIGIEAKPHIIKPNLHELGRLVGREIGGIDDALSAAEGLMDGGIEMVLVSMGRDGALMVGKNTRLIGIPPEVSVDSTVGAGDSFLAAFVLGYSRDMELKDCLRFGVAAGAAAAMTPGTELCRRNDVEDILSGVEVKEIQ